MIVTKSPIRLSISYNQLKDNFMECYNNNYYSRDTKNSERTPISFGDFMLELDSAISHKAKIFDGSIEIPGYKPSELDKYYAKIIKTYIETKNQLDLGVCIFITDFKRNYVGVKDPMIVENSDDYTYTKNDINDFPPSTKKKTTREHYEDMLISIIHALRCKDIKKEYTNSEDDMYGLSVDDKVDPIKLDEDWVSNVKEYLKDKERKVSHPDEDLLIRITKLIFEWCETVGIDPSSAKYHILAELYSMMRRFIMLKTPKEKEYEKDND